MRRKTTTNRFGLVIGLMAFVAFGIIVDASRPESRAERARYRHFRNLERRSKDAWIARSSRSWYH